jgi:O-antigen/teichoic acid export membrane protein
MKLPKPGRLVKNAAALILSGAGSGAIGVVFWVVAAHLASAANVGRTSAEISAMTLLAALAQLSFGSTFERFIPVAGDRTRRFVLNAYALCCALAFVLAVAYVLFGIGHSFLPPTFGWRALFVAAVMMWTIFALGDSALIGLRATRWVPVENILYSLAKLALIPVFILVSAREGILLAWIIPVIAVISIVNWFIFHKVIPEHQSANPLSEAMPSLRELVTLSTAQYSNLLVTVLSGSIISLIVIDRLGAVASAHYYLPAQLSGGVAMAVWNINRSFLVEASAEPKNLRFHARSAMRAGVFVVASSVTLGVIFAPAILKIFGPSYAASGTTLLRMFFLCLPGSAVSAFYGSFAWIDRRVWQLTIRGFVSTGVYFGLVFVFLSHYRVLAVGYAGLVESAVEGILFLPLLIKRYRKSQAIDVSKSDSEPVGDK